ncbi:hypothetical protein BS17DRAFT_781303 [Gyrodon lividus]|nr:hypothetical protein BS17DRAFT_781303 [Gyrodon lividus]
MVNPGFAGPAVQLFHRLSKLPQTDLTSIGHRGANSPRSVLFDSTPSPSKNASRGDSPRENPREEMQETASEELELSDFVMVELGPHDLPITLDDPPSVVLPAPCSYPFHGRKLKRPRCAGRDEESPRPAKRRQASSFCLFNNNAIFPGWIPEAIMRPIIKVTQSKSPSVAEGHDVLDEHTGNRQNNYRLSLTSIPDSVDGCSYWLTRSLKKPWTLRHFSAPLSYTDPSGMSEYPPKRAPGNYASCFVSRHRSHPSVIRWKSG